MLVGVKRENLRHVPKSLAEEKLPGNSDINKEGKKWGRGIRSLEKGKWFGSNLGKPGEGRRPRYKEVS